MVRRGFYVGVGRLEALPPKGGFNLSGGHELLENPHSSEVG